MFKVFPLNLCGPEGTGSAVPQTALTEGLRGSLVPQMALTEGLWGVAFVEGLRGSLVPQMAVADDELHLINKHRTNGSLFQQCPLLT